MTEESQNVQEPFAKPKRLGESEFYKLKSAALDKIIEDTGLALEKDVDLKTMVVAKQLSLLEGAFKKLVSMKSEEEGLGKLGWLDYKAARRTKVGISDSKNKKQKKEAVSQKLSDQDVEKFKKRVAQFREKFKNAALGSEENSLVLAFNKIHDAWDNREKINEGIAIEAAFTSKNVMRRIFGKHFKKHTLGIYIQQCKSVDVALEKELNEHFGHIVLTNPENLKVETVVEKLNAKKLRVLPEDINNWVKKISDVITYLEYIQTLGVEKALKIMDNEGMTRAKLKRQCGFSSDRDWDIKAAFRKYAPASLERLEIFIAEDKKNNPPPSFYGKNGPSVVVHEGLEVK